MHNCLNRTGTIFHILAFSTSTTGQCLLFIGALLMYVITVVGNMIIATLVCLVPQLHNPMYILLSNLAITDVMYISVTLPKLLSIIFRKDNRMSFSACMARVFFFSLAAVVDILMLTAMSYDRYVAICKPLQYSLFINKDVCSLLVMCPWLISAVNSAISVLVTSLLSFCPAQNVDHFFCEQRTLYAITSSDTTIQNIILVFQDMFMASISFLLIIISYAFIISAILNIRSSEGRHKAFSNCSSHLTTVIIFFCPVLILYTKPESEHSKDLDKLFSLLYTAVVPMLNPFVYTLRNKDILKAMASLAKSRPLLSCKNKIEEM